MIQSHSELGLIHRRPSYCSWPSRELTASALMSGEMLSSHGLTETLSAFSYFKGEWSLFLPVGIIVLLFFCGLICIWLTNTALSCLVHAVTVRGAKCAGSECFYFCALSVSNFLVYSWMTIHSESPWMLGSTVTSFGLVAWVAVYTPSCYCSLFMTPCTNLPVYATETLGCWLCFSCDWFKWNSEQLSRLIFCKLAKTNSKGWHQTASRWSVGVRRYSSGEKVGLIKILSIKYVQSSDND